MEDQPIKNNEDNSVIKALREQIKEAKAELKSKPSQEEIETLKNEVSSLQKTHLTSKYGIDNVDKALELKNKKVSEADIDLILGVKTNQTLGFEPIKEEPIIETPLVETEQEKFERETMERINKDK